VARFDVPQRQSGSQKKNGLECHCSPALGNDVPVRVYRFVLDVQKLVIVDISNQIPQFAKLDTQGKPLRARDFCVYGEARH